LEEYGSNPAGCGRLQVLDVTIRIAGTGSLGVDRYAVLVRIGDSPGVERLLDIKEMRTPALLDCARGEIQPEDGGSAAQRAVNAQRRLQAKPTARLDVLPVAGRLYRMRELIPEENRAGLDRLRKRPRRLRRAVAIAGRLTAWSHVRGSHLDTDDRSVALRQWAESSGLEAVIASAVRYADQTRRDYKAFCRAAREGLLR
jgi:uncharacterized protein (DUF2252 family)